MATQIPSGLIERVRGLLLTPTSEWRQIDAATMAPRDIYTGWVLPLAAIGPVAGMIGALVFGYGMFGISYRPSIGAAVTSAAIGYVMAIVSVWVISLIIDALAPNFGGVKNPVQALKVAAFSATAGWLAGIFQIIPSLSFLGLLGLYSLYLLYTGLPILMRAPADKAMPYTVVTIVVAFVVTLVAGAITTGVASMVAAPFTASLASGGTVSGKMALPGVGSVDLSTIEAASKKMEAAAERMKNGQPAAADIVPAETLQAMLPASIAGFARGDTEASSGGAGAIGGSRAEGRYTAGNQSFTLSVTDASALGAMATLGGALNVQSNKQTANGYEKTAMVGGRMTTEEWDRAANHGKYATMVGSRFMVEASGNAPSIDTLKGAVAAIDLGKLESLAK